MAMSILTAAQQAQLDNLHAMRAIRLAEAILQFERGRQAQLNDLRPEARIKYHELAQHVRTLLETT